MKISIKNIGLLDEAEFEIGDLTIICGENNTGKTYATYSVYGFLQSNSFGGNNGENFYDYSLKIIEDSVEKFSINNFDLICKKEDFLHIILEIKKAIYDGYTKYIPELFASSDDKFQNATFSEETFDVIHSFFSKNIDNINELIDFFSSSSIKIKNITNENIIFDCSFYKNLIKKNDDKDTDFRFNFIVQILRYLLSIYPRPFILSAERTGASMFYKELDVNKNEVLEQINNMSGKSMDIWNLIEKRYSRYPKPVKDNIYFIRELDIISKNKSFIAKDENLGLHKEIIELLFEVVGGKYITSQEGISFAPGAKKRATKGKYPVQTASSSVRALMMLNYYILNYCSKNDILMIDEPELNLHPNNQILIGRLLVLLVNAGIKVLITTHSDYIIRDISNCIMLYNLTNEQISKFKNEYKAEYKLKSSKVKAYIAKQEKGKNKLIPVKIEQKFGIFMDTFNEPINEQNEHQGKLYDEVMKTTIGAKDD